MIFTTFIQKVIQMLTLLLTADGPIFRVDSDSMTDQTRMEIFISDMPESFQRRFQDESHDFHDKCAWAGVRCEEDGNVAKISWGDVYAPVPGRISLDHLPPRLHTLNISNREDMLALAKLSGTVETTRLPDGLRKIYLDNNLLEGTFDFRRLPSYLQILVCSSNRFSGSAHLDALPQDLADLHISENAFSGSLVFANMPKALRHLALASNAFSGEISFSGLPAELMVLDVSSNRLSGSVDFWSLPRGLWKLDLWENEFRGDLDFSGLPKTMQILRIDQEAFSNLDGVKWPRCVSFQ